MVAATDVADLLVRRGMPFREAHGVVGGLVRTAVESGRSLSELTREELAAHSDLLDDEYYEVLAEGAWLDSKVSAGGTGAAPLAEQLEKARRVVADGARRRRERPPRRCLLRPLGPRRRARPDRLRAARRRHRRRHRRDRELRARRSRLPRLRRPHRSHLGPVRPARRTRTSTSPTASTACSTSSRAGGQRRRRAHPGARADGRPRRDARAPRAFRRRASSAPGPGKLTEALGVGLELNRAPLDEPPFELRGRAGRWREVVVATGPANRNHQGDRAAVALLRCGQRVPLKAAAAALTARAA